MIVVVVEPRPASTPGRGGPSWRSTSSASARPRRSRCTTCSPAPSTPGAGRELRAARPGRRRAGARLPRRTSSERDRGRGDPREAGGAGMTRQMLEVVTPVAPTAADERWYKDAVIYELHVRAFHDCERRRHRRLPRADPAARLPRRPRRHRALAPALLPLAAAGRRLRHRRLHVGASRRTARSRDFRTFLREAHARGLRVITELVLNHTSDQHPWFQRARRAPPGSPERDFYVWSDTPEQVPRGAHHLQGLRDLELDVGPGRRAVLLAPLLLAPARPELRQPARCGRRCSNVVDFWLDMGVDGLRLDAVPYLFEREGTNCENLPETHEFLKELRAHIDAQLRRTACCWPRRTSGRRTPSPTSATATSATWRSTSRSCRGCSWRCRWRTASRSIDILEQTPAIPENCQWAMFLRNHDELTLEMVTDEERDYMYRVYAQRPAGADQPRHPPPARAAAGQRPPARSS